MVDESVSDGRRAYLVAREIDELGAGAPTFEHVRGALNEASGVIAEACTRELAQALVKVCRAHGVRLREVPIRRRRPASPVRQKGGETGETRGFSMISWVLSRPLPVQIGGWGALAGVVLSGLLLFSNGSDPGLRDAAVPSSSGEALSSREIVGRALAGSVHVESVRASGIGFFVGPGRIVGSSSVVAPPGGEVRVVTADGRVHSGSVETCDAWLGCAAVAVPGAAGAPVEIGDATLLEIGESVLVVSGSDEGGVSVRQRIVTETSRVLMGLSFVALDEALPAGGVGGAVLDGRGRVVGIVDGNAADVALVLPVNYLYSGTDPVLTIERDSDERARWTRTAAEAAKVEQEQLAGLLGAASRPVLMRAEATSSREILATVARVATSKPPSEQLEVRVLGRGAVSYTHLTLPTN